MIVDTGGFHRCVSSPTLSDGARHLRRGGGFFCGFGIHRERSGFRQTDFTNGGGTLIISPHHTSIRGKSASAAKQAFPLDVEHWLSSPQ